MKNNILKKSALALLSVGMLASCSEDYLNTEPITSIPATQVTSTVENAQMAVYGVCKGMFNQYQGATQGYNGEATIMMLNGEMPSQDYFYYQYAVGFPQYCNMEIFHETVSAYYTMFFPWAYSYTMINGANVVIKGIDKAEGDEAKRKFVKAQALTLRAHGYTRLLQMYAPRWADSNNGEENCLVLRIEDMATGDSPLVSMNEIFKLIYDDMTTAISLMEEEGVKNIKRTFEWEPDYGVACGVFARAALLKNDWETAATMAAKARKGYSLMSNEEYHSGFCAKNKEWMWNSSGDVKDQIYYWSHGVQFACNGYFAVNTDNGAGAANVLLLRQFPENDIRRQLFLVEGNYYVNDRGQKTEVMSLENWYKKDNIIPQSISIDTKKGKYSRAAKEFLASMKPATLPSTAPAAYVAAAGAESNPIFQYGAQIKFWVNDLPGIASVCFMRASEMLLIEAEARAEMGGANEATAQALLNELNKERQPGYTCTKSGDELIEEVRLYRRLELWGEGFNFFDFKRWNIAIDRKGWTAGDTTSGNAPATIVRRIEPQDGNQWRYAIPRFETQYNLGINNEPITSNNPK